MTKTYYNLTSNSLIKTPFLALNGYNLDEYIKSNAEVSIISGIIYLRPTANWAEIHYNIENILLKQTEIEDFSLIYTTYITSYLNNIDFSEPILFSNELMYLDENRVIVGNNINVDINSDFFVLFPNFFPSLVVEVRKNNVLQDKIDILSPRLKYNVYKYSNITGKVNIRYV